MRLLHIIASADPQNGGPIEGVLQQAKNRKDRRGSSHVVEVATLDLPNSPFLKNYPLKVYALGQRIYKPSQRTVLPWRRYGYSAYMVRWLKANAKEYDLVVVNGLWNYSTFSARRCLVKSKTPYVVFTHGMLDPWFKKNYPKKSILKQIVWWLVEGPLLNNANAVLFTTEEERNLARNVFKPYRLAERVVNYGTGDVPAESSTQISCFHASFPHLKERSLILFLGRIHEKKGCDMLIEAFASVVGQYPHLDLAIAGPDETGWGRSLRNRSTALGIGHRIHWLGMLTGDLKWGAFKASEAFILPSHQENFGIVVAEAMACGKPVLLTDKVNTWREVEACGGGLVESDTIDGISRLLTRFLSLSTVDRTSMGCAARAGFLERFEASKAFQSIDKTFVEVVEAHVL